MSGLCDVASGTLASEFRVSEHPMADESDDFKFAMTEYHEAANAYFKGVDIGYTAVKGYITLNALFAALIGGLADPKVESLKVASEMVRLVPGFAIVASLTLLMALPHYFSHLENCRRRCEEIESLYKGRLFTKLGGIARGEAGSTRFRANANIGLIFIVLSFLSFWAYFGIKLRYPDFELIRLVKSFIY